MKRIVQVMTIAWGLSLALGCGGGNGNTSGGGGGPVTSHFSISGANTSAAGFAFSITVTAEDSNNAPISTYAGTVHFSSSDVDAVIPADSKLTNGSGNFSVTLTNAGSQIVTVTDTTSSSIRGSLNVTAIAGEFPVGSFGAKADGKTDDTAAIQAAINAAAASGGGSVVLSIARYFTAGSLVIPTGVVLCGPTQGPYDINGVDPALTAVAPTLLVTNTTNPFLTLQGIGAAVTDVLFHYPNQVHTTASAPNPYPYTIVMAAPGTKVARSVVTNAYDFLDIEAGRVMVFDMFIGAFHNDIKIDHAAGHVMLHNLIHSVFWDIVENVPVPSPIDTWMMANSVAFNVGRVDGLQVSDVLVFLRFTGMLLSDSPDTSQNPRCGYGTASNIDLDTMQYGIVITASNTPGYKFTNMDIGSGYGGETAVQVGTGGSMPPKIEINGGSQRGYWALGAYPPAGPDTVIVNILP